MLNGEEVHQWKLQSPSLGTNLEGIQQFLRATGSQIGMPILRCATIASPKVNDLDLTMDCPVRIMDLYTTGFRLAIDSLRSGLQEQRSVGRFDRGLAQSTFEFADKVLHQLMQ